MVEEVGQAGVETAHIQQGAGFLVVSQLAPGPDLEQFFQRAQTTGQGDEAVGQAGHHGLALVHGAHDVQAGELLVGQFLVGQEAWDDADDFAPSLQDGVGHGAHQADRGPPVDEPDTGISHGMAQFDGRQAVGGGFAGAGTAEDAEFHEDPVPGKGRPRAGATKGAGAAAVIVRGSGGVPSGSFIPGSGPVRAAVR